MKPLQRIFRLCYILLISLGVNAQTPFFPTHVGNIWEYFVDAIPPESYRIEVTGDTLMPNSKTYQIFERKWFSNHGCIESVSYYRADDSLRLYEYRAPVPCNQEELVYDFSLPDSTVYELCINPHEGLSLPAVHNTFNYFYSYLMIDTTTRKYWGVDLDIITGDTLWGSIFFSETWIAQGIGIIYIQPEAGSPLSIVGAKVNGVEYGYVTPIESSVTQESSSQPFKHIANFPNPYNSETTIKYSVFRSGIMTVRIYNLTGQLVRTLVNGQREIGEYSNVWDGKDNTGQAVASGTYFYQIAMGKFSSTYKIQLVR